MEVLAEGDPFVKQIKIGKGMGPHFAEPPREIVGVIGRSKRLA